MLGLWDSFRNWHKLIELKEDLWHVVIICQGLCQWDVGLLGKAIPFFYLLVSNAFPYIGSVGRIEKKNLEKKSQEVGE